MKIDGDDKIKGRTKASHRRILMTRKSYQKGNLQFHRGCWTVRYRWLDPDIGKFIMQRHQLTGHTDERKKKEARRAADEWMNQINAHNNNPKQSVAKITVTQFIKEKWEPYVTVAKLSPSTLYGYQSLIRLYITPKLGGKILSKLTPADMTAFFDSLRREHSKLSEKYLLNIYSLLRRMVEIAHQYELIDSSPLKPILHKPKAETREKPIITVDEAKKLIDLVEPQHRLLLVVLWVTGMRIGEAIALRWLNLDFERRELSITNAVWRRQLKSTKTEASKRVLILPALLVDELRQQREASKFNTDADYIFATPDGQAFHTDHLRNYVLYPAMEKAGIERGKGTHGFHLIRHTAGSIVHRRTGDVKLVQELLGHSRIETTGDIYVHVDDESVGRAADILFAELGQNPTVN